MDMDEIKKLLDEAFERDRKEADERNKKNSRTRVQGKTS